MSFSLFISSFLKELNDENVSYLIERNYEHLPEYTSNDVDFLIADSDKQKFIAVAINVINRLKMKPLLITTAYGGGRIYLFEPQTNNSSVIRIDFMTHIHFRGIPLLNEEVILNNRQARDIFYIPKAGVEAAISLMVPLIYLGKIKEKYKRIIYEGCLNDRINFANAFLPFLPLRHIENIINAVLEKQYDVLEKQRKKILLYYIYHNAFRSICGVIEYIFKYIERVMNPSGIFVALMGADGSGKSTVVTELSEKIKILYPRGRFTKLHWRPNVLPQIRTFFGKSKLENEFAIANPHNPKKRSRITSFLRWLYYSIDYIIGFYLKILPLEIKTTAVVMDRYYYDIIVDPVRYGFNLPKWLLKLPLRFIPKPDLTIYLDNEPEELYKRKHELPVEEIERQVKEWRKFIPLLPNARIVTTDKPLDDVVCEVTKMVLERRAEMTRKILKIDPDESRYLWKTEITNYIALPSKKNCRWIIPSKPKLAERAWELYLPYSINGRIYKSILKFLSSQNLLGLIRPQTLTRDLVDKSAPLKKCISEVFKRDDIVLALSTGTSGPFRKLTAMILNSQGQILGFAKIGETPLAIECIKNEAKVLRILVNGYNLSEIRYPECLFEAKIGNSHIIILTPAPFKGKSEGSDFNEDYADILANLIKNTMTKKKFIDSAFYKNLKQGIEAYSLSYKEILKEGLKYLENSIGEEEVIFSLSHGDFAPWNMLWNDKKVFLFDWESASFEAPAGIDLIHFLFQTGFLIKKLSGEKLLDFCTNEKHYKVLEDRLKVLIINRRNLFLVYLLKMAINEDRPQQLSASAVTRRNLIKILLKK